jgi:predicted transposase YbfD/YdcC
MSRLPGGRAAQDAAGQESPAGLIPARLDGKTVRGARDADGNQRHLLAVLADRTAQSSVIAAQAEVGVKTNEVPMAKEVLGQIDLHGKLVSADALHTVKATAEFICEAGGEFVLPVKENRRALFDALDALPWDQVPVAHSATDRGHGRITTRTIQVLPAPEDLPFPHVSQVYLIERYVTDLRGSPVSAVAALGVASPPADRVSAAGLARHVREQWAIESLHWLRDTLYQEDKSQVRTRSGPRVMAALRNLAICALRLFGRTDVTEATRWASRSMDRPFAILGLTS